MLQRRQAAARFSHTCEPPRERGTTYEKEVEEFVEAHQIPARRFGEPSEVGTLVAYLCSVHAGYLTGQCIVVDGATTRSTF